MHFYSITQMSFKSVSRCRPFAYLLKDLSVQRLTLTCVTTPEKRINILAAKLSNMFNLLVADLVCLLFAAVNVV